jgi:type II secretory pathway pseudopilin PulG
MIRTQATTANPARSRLGATLLETILALIIFAGSAAVLYRLLATGGENAERAEFEADAWLIAESAWAELQSGVRALNDSGPFPLDESPGWQWSLSASSTDVPDLYRVVVRVEDLRNGPERARSLELTRFFFDDSAYASEGSP